MTTNKKARQGDDLTSLGNSFSPTNHIAQRASAARGVLLDAIIAADVDSFTSQAILAAAESYTKACLRDRMPGLGAELESGPRCERGVSA